MFNINFDYILCFAFILSTIMSMPIWKRFAITKQVNKYTYESVYVCVCVFGLLDASSFVYLSHWCRAALQTPLQTVS